MASQSHRPAVSASVLRQLSEQLLGAYSDWNIAEFAVWDQQLTPTETRPLIGYPAVRCGLVIA